MKRVPGALVASSLFAACAVLAGAAAAVAEWKIIGYPSVPRPTSSFGGTLLTHSITTGYATVVFFAGALVGFRQGAGGPHLAFAALTGLLYPLPLGVMPFFGFVVVPRPFGLCFAVFLLLWIFFAPLMMGKRAARGRRTDGEVARSTAAGG